jgi:hypothetical protein
MPKRKIRITAINLSCSSGCRRGPFYLGYTGLGLSSCSGRRLRIWPDRLWLICIARWNPPTATI